MRYAISYVSTVNSALPETEIQEVLDLSKKWNNDNNITGVLLYSQGNFFQVLEGEEQLLKNLYEKIKADERHHNIITIFQKQIPDIQFDGYETNFISLDDRFQPKNIAAYTNQVSLLNPAIQSSVKYILKNFTEGIK